MNQNEFFNILMDGLKDSPESRLQDIISYYENNFILGLASGKTEEEIINELGNPNLIVNKFRNENLKTPINSEHITNDDHITPINNKNSINNLNSADNNNSINNYATFTKDPNIVTKNNYSNSNFDKRQNSNFQSNNFDNQNTKNKVSQFNVNTILKICIAILALIIFFPVITGVIGCIIGLLGVAISILVASIGVLVGGTFTSFIGLPNVPMFVANFPYPVLVLFSLGSILLSILLILLFYYLSKFLMHISIKIYNSLKSKGGVL